MMKMEIPAYTDSSLSREATCMSIAAGLHILMLLWNPIVLRSDFHPAHDFVTVDVVEQPAPGGYQQPSAPEKKMGFMDTLKDMLMKPKNEEIAHVAPGPIVPRVAAPIQPALKERSMPHPIAQTFMPKSQADDIAAASQPNQIQANNPKMANVPTSGPALTSKSFGGIRTKDLPFAVSGDDSLSGGQAVIPVAVGSKSAKAALNYGGASLAEKGHHVGIASPRGLSGNSDTAALGAGAAQTIQLGGTGGTGNAPTGANSGSALQDRAGSGGGGGLVSRSMGGGLGRGGGVGSGIEGIPSAAQQLDQQLNSGSTGGAAKKGKQAFDIAGPLNNRPIVNKVIPQYPAWAEEQGIIGSVRLYFTVTPEGTVRTNIRVTKTTGYPQLDQLGIDALKQWRFAPAGASDEGKGEWGIITFNFSLSS